MSAMGRPLLPKGKAKATILSVRLSPEERAAIDVAAAVSGEKASAWARRVLLTAATRIAIRRG